MSKGAVEGCGERERGTAKALSLDQRDVTSHNWVSARHVIPAQAYAGCACAEAKGLAT
jgi:hypothetical protein